MNGNNIFTIDIYYIMNRSKIWNYGSVILPVLTFDIFEYCIL